MWLPVTEEELLLYVDGHLPHARADAVESHLEANPRDATRIGAYCRQNLLLRALGRAIATELPPAGEVRLRHIVAQHAARVRRRRAGTLAAALLVGAMLGIAGIGFIHTSKGAPVAFAQRSAVQPVAAVAARRR